MKILVLLFACTFVNGAKCQKTRNVRFPGSSPSTFNETLPSRPSNETLPSRPSNEIVSRNLTIPLPTERSGISDDQIENKTNIPTEITRVLEYLLVVENLQNDLYRRYQRIDNTFTDRITSLLGNVNVIRSLNNTVNRPPCTYFFNDTSIDSMKAELEKFERIAIGMYNSLNIMEGSPLFELKLRHKTFLDLMTGTFNTPVLPVSLRTVIGITAGNTIICNVDIPFVSFFRLTFNSNITRHNEVLTVESLILPNGRHCAFVGINGTVWSNIEGKTCKVPVESSTGMNHIYIVNDTVTPVTDTSINSVISGPAQVNILSAFDDGTRIISFASSKTCTNSFLVILLIMMFL